MTNQQYKNGNNEQYGAVPEAGGGGELPTVTLWVHRRLWECVLAGTVRAYIPMTKGYLIRSHLLEKHKFLLLKNLQGRYFYVFMSYLGFSQVVAK